MPKKITDEQVEKIYESHEMGLSRWKASKYAGVSPRTVSNYWRKKGLSTTHEKKIAISSETREKIYDAHKFGMNLGEIADYSGVSISTVHNYLNERGLKSKIKQGSKISEEQQKDIYDAHEMGMSQAESAECAGVTDRTVSNYWKQYGLKPHFKFGNNPGTKRKSGKKSGSIPFETRKKIREAYWGECIRKKPQNMQELVSQLF